MSIKSFRCFLLFALVNCCSAHLLVAADFNGIITATSIPDKEKVTDETTGEALSGVSNQQRLHRLIKRLSTSLKLSIFVP